MKTRSIAFLMGMTALAAAAEPSMNGQAHAEDGSAEPEAAPPIGILIMAQGRSGSTMVGEFLRQNKDALYFYEPCRKLRGTDMSDLECLAFLQRLTQCTFSRQDSAWIADDDGAAKSGSPALKSLRTASGAKEFGEAHKQLVGTCMRSKVVAVKSIRLGVGVGGKDYDLGRLKVLHLVRDPRGVVRSQRKQFKMFWGAPSGADSATIAHAGGASVCGTYKKQLDSSEYLGDDRYLLVRYEDIAASPELAAAFIYYWSGLGTVPAGVSEWIEVNTHIPTCDDGTDRRRRLRANPGHHSFAYLYATASAHPFAGRGDVVEASALLDRRALGAPLLGAGKAGAAVVTKKTKASGGGGGDSSSSSSSDQSGEIIEECAENTKEASHNPFGTRRQSAAMASMWRTLMPEQDAQSVWEACEESGIMDALGYYP